MKGYNFPQIISSIYQGTDIKVEAFKDNLSSRSRLNSLKAKSVKLTSVLQLVRGLISLNSKKFMLCLLFFGLTLALTVSGPFIVNLIMSRFLSPEDFSLPWLIGIIISYKVANSLVSVICNFLSSSLGFEYFAYLYWRILNHHEYQNLGKTVNIVEYDCNLITNIVYSSLTSVFYFLEIMVLFGLLIAYLAKSEPYSMFFLLICGYLVSQCLVSLATFAVNRTYMSQKDRRLGANIADSCDEKVMEERAKELKANRRFLLMKMVSKLVSLTFPILINIYIFLIADRSSIQDNQYTILVLVNLIRSPIAELMTAMNLNAQILNSCSRIVELVEGSPPKLQQQSLSDQLIEEKALIVGRFASKEKGDVSLQLIWKSLKQTIEKRFWVGLVLLYVWLVGSKFYGNIVTQHIMDENCSLVHYLGLCCQIVAPVLVYFTIIVSIEKVAFSLFSKLKKEMDYETLNRISGDIAAIDRSVTINSFEIGFSFSIILSSYLYSITSLGLWWLQALLILFLGFSIWLVFSLNRFIMRSRREVARRQLQMKASILKGLLKGHRIVSHPKLKRNWFRIFECKQMGLFIQNYYMIVVSLLMLLLSLLFIVLSEWMVQDSSTKSILLMVCLSIDRDMVILFFAMVRLELSLVSFERVLNALSL